MKSNRRSPLERVWLKARRTILPHLIRDQGASDEVTILAGMGRSGTTWVGDIINHDGSYRVLFEPFFPPEVSEAELFEYIQYLNPESEKPALADRARTILAGKPRNAWVDRDNTKLRYDRRLVKDVRCNMMLGWLKRVSPRSPIVVVVRHPLAVTASWMRLGWGREARGNRLDHDIITSQPDLLRDFPVVEAMMGEIDTEDVFELTVFEWCVFHLVPLAHLAEGDGHFLSYENLVLDTESEAERLFRYLEEPFDWQALRRTAERSSSTNFLERNFRKDREQVVTGWRTFFSKQQIERAAWIVAQFGLDGLYDRDGLPTGEPRASVRR